MTHLTSDSLYDDFFEQKDPERAVAHSDSYLGLIRDEMLDPTGDPQLLRFATDAMADGPDGDPHAVLSAVKSAERAFRDLERGSVLDVETRRRARGFASIMRAQAEHRAGRYREAVAWCISILTWLENEAGGVEELRRVMASPKRSTLAELTTWLLAIHAASLRRASLTESDRDAWIRWGRLLVDAYLTSGDSDGPVVYERTEALAAQWFYLAAALMPEDVKFVEAMYWLDVYTRPRHARAGFTRPLRENTIAVWRGDTAAAEQHAQEAERSLAQLPRHRARVERFRLVAA